MTVLQYACDTCLARPGDPCLTVAGRVKYEPHAARAQLASHDGWVLHDALKSCANYADPYDCWSAGIGPAARCDYCKRGPSPTRRRRDEERW